MLRNAPQIPLNEISRLLRELPDCVILRNQDFAMHLKEGGDIDLLVEDPLGTREKLFKFLGYPLAVMEWSYVHGLLWRWGLIDIIPRLEWHGAEYFPKGEVLKKAVANKHGVRQAHPIHEALIAWLTKLVWGGSFKDNYRPVILDVAKDYPGKFLEALEYAVGPSWGNRLLKLAQAGTPEVAVQWVKPLRRALFWRAFRREPLKTVNGWLKHWIAWICVHVSPPMPWVAFLGLDGSGKTSVISEIVRVVNSSYWTRGIRVEHWRPGLFLRNRNTGPVTDPHSKPPWGGIASAVKVLFLLTDWWLGYWANLCHFRAEWRLLIFDRHFVDLLVDPKRYRYGGPMWLARLVSRVIPKPDLFIFLDLPAEVAQARKPEVALDDARKLRGRYLELAGSLPNAHVVQAARPLQEVTAEVERIILDYMAAETCRRLGLNG